MIYIHMTFSKKTTPLHSTELFKIFFSLLTLSTAFLQKASGPAKNANMSNSDILWCTLVLHSVNKLKVTPQEFKNNAHKV